MNPLNGPHPLALLIAALLAAPAARAGVVTDGTLGARRALNGPDMRIGEALGRRAGANLFHSFERFSIANGESATFTGSADIRNVISRVTGGEASTIDGLLKSEVGQSDFYFINPAGVVFGPNAQIDVPASLHVATAQELRMADGTLFSAVDPSASTLTTAAPQAFGFLGGPVGTVGLQGDQVWVDTGRGEHIFTCDDLGCTMEWIPELKLQNVPFRASIPGAATFAGGDVRLDVAWIGAGSSVTLAAVGGSAGEVSVIDGGPKATAVGGTVSLDRQSVASAGLVRVSGGEVHLAGLSNLTGNTVGVSVTASGLLELASGAWVEGQGSPVDVTAGTLVITDTGWDPVIGQRTDQPEEDGPPIVGGRSPLPSGIYSEVGSPSHHTDKEGGTVTIQVQGEARIDRGRVSTRSVKALAPGEVQFSADSLVMTQASIDSINGSWNVLDHLDPSTLKGGPVRVEVAGAMELGQGSRISTTTNGAGDAAVVGVAAGSLTLTDGSSISSDTTGPLNAGAVDLRVAGEVRLEGGSKVSSSTASWGGDAGRVLVDAQGLTVSGAGSGLFTDAAAGLDGRGGDLDLIIAGLALLRDGGQISASTGSEDPAGQVHLQAGALQIDGGDLGLPTGIFTTGSAARDDFRSLVSRGGPAGSMDIRVGDWIELKGGGRISSSTFGIGDGGTLHIQAGDLRLVGGTGPITTGLFAVADVNEWSAGLTDFRGPGSIDITAGTVALADGAEISAENRGGIAPPAGAANPSEIRIRADDLDLASGSRISTASHGDAPAGAIDLRITDTLRMTEAEVSTEAEDGDGGPITIDPWMVWLNNSRITTSVLGAAGNGGDIALTADNLILQGGFIQANTAATGASGGRVTLDVGTLIPWGGEVDVGNPVRQAFRPGVNVIQAAAPEGIAGAIEISAPDLDVSSGLVGLDTGYADAAALFHGPCVQRGGGTSRLAWIGEGGLPWRAGEPLLTGLTAERLRQWAGEGATPPAPGRSLAERGTGRVDCRLGVL